MVYTGTDRVFTESKKNGYDHFGVSASGLSEIHLHNGVFLSAVVKSESTGEVIQTFNESDMGA